MTSTFTDSCLSMQAIARQQLTDYAASEMRRVSQSAAPPCKVCGGPTGLFDVVDFGRQCNLKSYPDGLIGVAVYFHRCSACGLLFSEFFDAFTDEMWRAHVYNDDYARIDPEYAGPRSRRNVGLVRSVVGSFWAEGDRGCDFGGGQGATARRLTEQGYDFDSIDPFGDDAKLAEGSKFRVVTAFEVLEHSPTPKTTFAQISALCRDDRALILLSTSLVPPGMVSGKLPSWWYAAPRNGHITLHTERSIRFLAAAHSFEYRGVARGIHVLGRGINLGRIARAALVTKVLQRVGLRRA